MKRVIIFKNGKTEGGKVVAVGDSILDVLSAASRKLNFEVTELYTASGGNLDDAALIKDDEVLYAASGEPFIRSQSSFLPNKSVGIADELYSGENRDFKDQQIQVSHQQVCAQSEWVHLNVGGKPFATTVSTLTRVDGDSMLARMFTHGDVEWQSSVDETGAYLIDRSPRYFEPILNYLRHGQLVLDKVVNPEGVLEEAKFFGLTSLIEQLEDLIEREQPPDDDSPITRRELVMALMVTPTNKELRCQTPDDFLSKDSFDAIQNFIITKRELEGRLITVTAFGKKFVGCPVIIDNTKYKRNAFIFNVCFVFDKDINTASYGLVVKKLAAYLIQLEMESQFLSDKDKEPCILQFLQQVRDSLNRDGVCRLDMGDSCTVHLKVTPHEGQHVSVQDHDVPVLIASRNAILHHPWDLTTQQILHHVDGTSHVVKIAAEADVDINLVKACLQNLLYFNVVKMVSIFQYCNVYTCTPDIHKLFASKELQQECLRYVARNEHSLPSFRDVFLLYCSLTPGTTLKDICTRFNPHNLRIDERRLIQFGLLKGLIRRLQKYPVKLQNESTADVSPRLQSLSQWLGGNHSYDEISCKTGLSHQELEDLIEKDPSCVICWK